MTSVDIEYTDEEIIKMIVYIKQKNTDIDLSDGKEILRMIIAEGVEDHKIHTKGNGTQVKFKDLPYKLIVRIYNFIQTRINNKIEQLNQMTEEYDEITE